MNKFFNKIIGASLAIAMMVGAGIGIGANKGVKEVDAAGDVVYKSVTFSSSTMSTGVQNYTTDSWTNTTTGSTGISVSLAYFNNNNKGWNYVKCGNKTSASVASIKTISSIDKPITKVIVTIDSITASSVNSIKLLTSSNGSSWTEAGTYAKETGAKSVELDTPSENLYYKVDFDCKKGSSNGLVQVSRVDYYSSPSKTVQANSVTIKSGDQVVSGTYEPTSRYSIGGELDLTESKVNYQEGTDYEKGSGNIEWASSNSSVATVQDGVVTFVAPGTATITATAEDKGADNATISNSFTLDISNIAGLSYDDPLTVAEAKAAIDNLTTVSNAYVAGIVSKFPNNPFADGSISYYISDDGATSSFQLEAYKGKGIGGVDFENANGVKIGAAVVVKGNLLKYNSTYELAEGNQLVSYVTPYTVSFNTNGGSAVASQIVLDGETASRPADPTKAATLDYTYSFVDWYDNSSLTGDPYDFDTPVTADLVLYAKWNEIPAPAKDVIGRMTTGTQLSYYYHKTGDGARDHLNKAFTGVTSTSQYSDWKDKTDESPAIYAGNSCGNHGSIQLRSNNSNSGIVTTTSGGNAKIVKIVWNSNTASGKIVDVYGKSTAYESAADLYKSDKQGTKIGSISTTGTTLTITDDYAYIGLRSNDGAIYLDSIMIQWDEVSYDYSDISIRFGGNVTKDLWNRLDSESTVTGFGVMITEAKNVDDFDEFKAMIGVEMFVSSTENKDVTKNIVDYFVPVANMNSIIGKTETNYFWNLRFDIDEANMYTEYSAIAYIKINEGYVFMNMATESVESLAIYNLTEGGYNASSFDGSLQAIVDNA